MIATTQKVKGNSTSPPRVGTARVQLKARPGAGNRHRADSFERQAERVAAHVVCSHQTPSPTISAAPAAAYYPTGGMGQPLPHLIRETMEETLGADLGEVRVHNGTAADMAAREFGAQAFTSGRNIYFRTDYYVPQTKAGRQLLAHELTHVLQQTGRRDSRGRLRATNIAGAGQVQCKDDEFVELADKFALFDAPVGWKEVKRAYADVPESATHIAAIEKLLPPTLPLSTAQLAALIAPTTAASFKALSNQIKGLYVDILKVVGAYNPACMVLLNNPLVPTAFRSRPFYEYMRTQSVEWIGAIAAADSFTKTYYPDRLVAVYGTYLWSPGMPALDLDPNAGKKSAKTFQAKILAELDAVRSTKGLHDNELRATMLLAFYYLDVARHDAQTGALKVRFGSRESLYENLAVQYARGFAEALSPSPLKESRALFAAVLPQIKEVAIKAAKFWNRSLKFQKAVSGKGEFRDLNAAEVQLIAQGLKTDNTQPAAVQREGTSLTKTAEKPSNKVVPKQPADAQKASALQAKKESEFLPAVDEGASKESAATETPGGKEIPGARATPEKAPTRPEEDSGYQAVVKQVERKTKQEKTPPKKPAKKAQEVKDAAVLSLKQRQEESGSGHHLQLLESVPTPVVTDFTVEGFTEKFRAKVNEIADELPKAKDDQGAVSRAVAFGSEKVAAIQEVKTQNQNLSKPFRDEAARDPLALADKAVAAPELTVDPPGDAPEIKQTRIAAVKPKTDQEISLDDESRALDDALRNQNAGGQPINIDEDSLAFPISGERTFEEAGETKRKAQEEIQKANPRYREAEKKVITKSETEMPHIVKTGLKDQHQSRSNCFDNVLGTQKSHQENIEAKKGDIFKQFQDIYKETKGLVEKELAKLTNIETSFEAVLNNAEKEFTDAVHKQLEYIYTPGFFDYSDWKDINAAEIDKEYERLKKEKRGQQQQSFGGFDYLKLEAMNNVRDEHARLYFNYRKDLFISRISDGVHEIAVTVVGALNEAKKHIREGETKHSKLYAGLTPEEQKEVDTASGAVMDQYKSLDETVGDRQREIIHDMARNYSSSVGKLRATFDEIKKDVLTSWLKKAWNKIKAVVNAIIEFATRIAELLGRIVYLLGDIISSPRAFFTNLVTGIGQGFSTFVDRIDEFLATAFFDWIRGTSGVQVQLPKEWNPAGIFSLFTQLLNLSTETIWQRMEVVYDKAVANAFRRGEVVLEKGLQIFGIIKKEGLGGLWDHIRESLGTLLSDTLDAIKETVLYAAIKKVIVEIGKMLVPGGGFIAIAEKVIRLLQFIVEARNKILDLIESFVTSMENAVKGDIAGIVKLITTALTRFITIALDFLVSFFGLSSVKEKVERFIERMRNPVIRGIDFVLQKFKPLVMKGKEVFVKGKEKVIGAGKKVAGAVTGWVRRLLGIEKRFQGEDGSNHRLYFAEQASTTVLMINPDPANGFESWVAHITPDTSSQAGKRRAQKKTQAIAKAQEIDRVKVQPVTGNTDAEKQASEEQRVKTIRGLMDELSALTGPLFTGERPDCAIEGHGLEFPRGLWSDRYGTTMQAKYLTNIKMPTGSVPAPPHLQSFEVINQRRSQGGSYYVKGHLLNHNLGGTGRDWKNLTPLTREANSAHESIAEARVKNAVTAGNIVYYEVRAQYGRFAPQGPNRTIQDIINEEVHVPKKLVCEAALVTPANVSSSGRETRTQLVPANTEIDNSISQRPEDYDLKGIRHETVYLDSGEVDVIAGIEGVDRRLAQKIVDACDDKRSRFGSMVALAEYQFSDGRTFTALQKNTILNLSDLGYVRLYERE